MEPARGLHAVGGTGCTDHEILPKPDTCYSVSGINTNLQATLTNQLHYPVEAICRCGMMIRAEHVHDDWQHTGRRPGDPR